MSRDLLEKLYAKVIACARARADMRACRHAHHTRIKRIYARARAREICRILNVFAIENLTEICNVYLLWS